ncbi:MAG: 5'-methylthioadenosine/S-adenosylhomocysteine nucleosidase [Anaerolineae bacterium]|nr:5'-methylthioadenosine/S-adenosylhomocysteine nucleosidase [Anaerolineae bacterium]
MLLPPLELNSSPLGQWFEIVLKVGSIIEPVLFFHGGWGKIAAAASTQYVLDRWSPRLLVNLGTCGGFEGEIEKGTIILVERTLVYDIIELMGDRDEHLAHYTTRLDLSWLKEDYPHPVRRTLLVSADRDVLTADIPRLKAEFGAVAGDWESAAIAWVAARQQTPCLILRGVSDLIGGSGGEAYDGNIHVFVEGTTKILKNLIAALPDWLAQADV